MKRIWKRTIALLLVVLMLGGAAPMGVIAVSTENETVTAAAETEDEPALPGYKAGDIIEFGSYPQSEVKDAN